MIAKNNDVKSQSVGSQNQTKKALNKNKVDNAGKTTSSSPLHLKLVMKETAHSWASAVYDQAIKIHVLQKVLIKKEDPSTHKRFIEVLRQTVGNSTNQTNIFMSKGELVSLFWSRFASSLQDICIEKLKYNSTTTVLLYPYLRKAGIEAFYSIENMYARNSDDDKFGNSSITFDMNDTIFQNSTHEILSSSYEEIFCTIGLNSKLIESRLSNDLSNDVDTKHRKDGSIDQDKGFVIGLKPILTNYLMNVLSKLNAPILQMFPSLDG